MNITQTKNGWAASEENKYYGFLWKTFVNQNTQTIKQFFKINNKTAEVYTLTLEKESFTFTRWDEKNIQKSSIMKYTCSHDSHLLWGICILRNKPFNKGRHTYHEVNQELFGIPILGYIESKSELAQALYRKPGIDTLWKLLKIPSKRNKYFDWKDIEAIYQCPWENKYQLIEKAGIENGRYLPLFSSPKQFIQSIQHIQPSLIESYLEKGLPQIPKKLKTVEEIKKYLQTQIQTHVQPIPTSLQHIHSLLGYPIKRRSRIKGSNIKLYTDNLQITIEYIYPFPLLHVEEKTPWETEMLLCEELGMRSPKYIPSRLKRY